MKSQLLGFTVLAFVLLVALDVNGQTTGTGGGTTTGGNATGGNTTGGNTTGGNTAGGNTTSTGTATASATDGLSPTTAFTQLSNTGVGASADTVRGLNTTSVAAGTATSATGGRGGGGGGGGGLGGLGSFGLGGFGASGFGQGFGSSTPAKPTLRTRLRSSIDVAPLASQQIQSSAQSRFYQTQQTSRLRGVQVNMVEGTAVINGVVGSEKDRRMSELLMRLEPGVRRVNNQVTVSP